MVLRSEACPSSCQFQPVDNTMNSNRCSRLIVGAVAISLVLFIASACGSKTSGIPEGSGGTAGSPARVCVPGDTRACIGPAACSGGQLCEDARWTSCDCGTEGGAGGVNGAGAPGVAGASGAAPGAGGSSGSVSEGAAGEAGASNLNPGDEACPEAAALVDCSGQCGAKSSECEASCPILVSVPMPMPGQVVARLPSHPGVACICKSATPAAYAVRVYLQNSVPNAKMHITVPPPWHVTNSRESTPCTAATEQACGMLVATDAANFGGAIARVWTADPNAPSINLIAEPGACP